MEKRARSDSSGQDWDLHGEADAGAHKAAAAKRTARAAVGTSMVPEGRGCGSSWAVLGTSAGKLCSSDWPFIGSETGH